MNCTELEAEMCDNCLTSTTDSIIRKRMLEADEYVIRDLKRKKGYHQQQLDIQQRERDNGSHLEYIPERHDWLQGKYAMCWLIYDEIETEHVTRSCQLLEQELGEP